MGRDLLAAAAARRLHLPLPVGQAAAGLIGELLFGPRKFRAPEGLERFPAASVGEEVLALYADRSGSSLLQLPDLEFLRWLTSGYSGLGHFVPLYFHDGDRLRGWSLSRIYRTRGGVVASLVDLYWPRGDVAAYAWMSAETVSCLLSFRLQRIVTTATSPILQAALRGNHFRVTGTVPVHFWGKGRELGDGVISLAHNYADWPILPYPAEDVGTRFLVG